MKLSGLYIYPIKSMAGISLDTSLVERRGLKFDRRWMLINSNNDFMTQRYYPQMALLQPEITESGIKLYDRRRTDDSVLIPFEPVEGIEINVPIWDDRVTAVTVDNKIDDWLSEKIGEKCSIVFMPDTTNRQVDTDYASDGDIVGFADGYPFLLIGEASLEDLNLRLNKPIPMNRFRPNLVFSGGNPYEEDEWNEFTISGLRFRVVKPCGRCVIITTDQDTIERDSEPLTVLSKYRNVGNKVMFGQNVIGYDEGRIHIGDEIKFE